MVHPGAKAIPVACPFARIALLLVACGCLAGCWGMVPDGLVPDDTRDTMVGMTLSAEEAEALEARLRSHPDELSARAQLLSYYSHARWADDAKARRHGWHVVWLVENDPRHPLLAFGQASIDPNRDPSAYARVKAIWMAHLKEAPRDTGLLGAAAAAFEHGPDRDLALSLLERAQEIDPGDFQWPSRLGNLRWRMAQEDREQPDPVLAAEALSDFERAAELQRHFASTQVDSAMEAAFAAGEFDKARAYAVDALDGGGMPFSLAPEYRANLFLGRIALAEGDAKAAGDYLIAAGRVAAWPSLSPLWGVWRPDTQLAEELLERGERQVVLEYLELCARHWEGDQLREWANKIRAGGNPDLGEPYLPF